MGRNHHGRQPSKSNANIEAFRDFINALFGDTAGPVNLCTLRNNAGGAGAQITTSDSDALKKFVAKHDRPGWGVYTCVSTMLDEKRHHSKESIKEIPALHIDIDLKDLAIDSKDDVVRKLKAQLRLPPSIVVDSGNGIHAYWRFKEACGAGDIERIEDALKLLCDLVGGDQKVTQPSAVMRLPGTHNTKREGQNHLVTILEQNDNFYELDDLEEWLSETSPIILRKERPAQQTGAGQDFYSKYGDEHGCKMPVDVEKRLGAMMYMGVGKDSIHDTQLAVSASLLEAGEEIDDIVKLLMDATRIAAGDYGKHWNWTKKGKWSEEYRIHNMCET
jgi:hypothetical protein